MRDRLTNIEFSTEKRILVVGDIMLDQYWSGDVNRISPEAPIPIVKVRGIDERLGGAANVALNIAKLGPKVTMVGIVGNDKNADTVTHLLKENGIDCQILRNEDVPTITKLRVTNHGHQMLRLDFEEKFDGNCPELLKLYEDQMEKCDLVVLSDYAKGTLVNSKHFIARARKQGLEVLVDPKGDCFEKYESASCITPNKKEFEAVVGVVKAENELLDKGRVLLETHNFGALLVTRSEDGMTWIGSDGQTLHVPAKMKEVADVTGAGDTVIATLAASIVSGYSIESGIVLANEAAGICVGRRGVVAVSQNDISVSLKGSGSSRGKILQDSTAFFHNVDAQKRANNKIVFTNGCFDILHPGHVQYLRSAKALGNILIVAVNSDHSVKRLKGEARPINSLKDRMVVLSELEAVDFVIPFYEDTPLELIKSVMPDVLVKGGDYSLKEIVGWDVVLDNGGEVKALEFVNGCSTTGLINKIMRR